MPSSYDIDPNDPSGAVIYIAQISNPNYTTPAVDSAITGNISINNIENPTSVTTLQSDSNTNTNGTTNTAQPIVFDDTDEGDYGSRFFISDNINAEDNSSDIAFFNFVDINDYSNIVFPSQQYPISVNAGAGSSPAPGVSNNKYRQFIVTSISHPQSERFQIIENDLDFTLNFFSGQKPEFLQISGILKNTQENPWNMNMLLLWDSFMRGSRLAKLGLIMQIYIDGMTYLGYPVGFQRSQNAGNDFIVNFNMGFIIRKKVFSTQKNQQILALDNAIKKITQQITKNTNFASEITVLKS